MKAAHRRITLEIPVDATSGEARLDDSEKIVWRIVREPPGDDLAQYRTSLGKRLGEIRSRLVSSGTPLLNREELDLEIAERKGRRDEENLH